VRLDDREPIAAAMNPRGGDAKGSMRSKAHALGPESHPLTQGPGVTALTAANTGIDQEESVGRFNNYSNQDPS
jgi:hypothetical protein